VANILEDHMAMGDALAVEEALLFKQSISVAPVSREDYFAALREAKEGQVGLTDALAYVVMKERGLKEAYSFDRDFDRLGLVRVSA
jgi:uncharacterized protein